MPSKSSPSSKRSGSMPPPFRPGLAPCRRHRAGGGPRPVTETFGVNATSIPAGNGSVKATPVRAKPVLGFVRVNVRVLTPPMAMGFGENDLLIPGAVPTMRISLPVLPVPPLVEVTLPEGWALSPAEVARTLTDTVQVPLAAMAPPEKLSDVFPAAGAKAGEPQPVVETLGVAATSRPAGDVSGKANPAGAGPGGGGVIAA